MTPRTSARASRASRPAGLAVDLSAEAKSGRSSRRRRPPGLAVDLSTVGQVSFEAIVAMIMLVVVAAVVYLGLGERQLQVDFVRESVLQGADCSKLAAAISVVGNAQANAQAEVTLAYPAEVSGNNISFSANSCYFSGPQVSAGLNAGAVAIRKVEGVVSIGNA